MIFKAIIWQSIELAFLPGPETKLTVTILAVLYQRLRAFVEALFTGLLDLLDVLTYNAVLG